MEYLFLITCRTLVKYSSSPSFLNILTEIYGKSITQFIDENSTKCCFLFDGADEYGGLNNIVAFDKVKKNEKE